MPVTRGKSKRDAGAYVQEGPIQAPAWDRRAVEAPARRRARLKRRRNVAIAVSLAAIWALFLAVVPRLLEIPEEWLFAHDLDIDLPGNVAAVCLMVSCAGSVALPALICWRYRKAMDATGLAPLVSVERVRPAYHYDPNSGGSTVWPARFADSRVRDAVEELRALAERVDASVIADPAWRGLQADLAPRLSHLDDALMRYLSDVDDLAERVASDGAPLETLIAETDDAREDRVEKAVSVALQPPSDALLAAYRQVTGLLRGILNDPANGVAAARAKLDAVDKALAVVDRFAFPDGYPYA